MTTKVLIVNHGPSDIEVFVVPLTGTPPKLEALKEAVEASTLLAPTGACEQYVHTHQTLFIRER